MAFHCRIKLPALKLTKRTVGYKATSVVHRGVDRSKELVEPSEQLCASSDQEPEPDCVPSPVSRADDDDDDDPTLHELQSKADIRGWEKLRHSFLRVATECSAMPLGQLCVICQSPAEFRCQECGSAVFYCHTCFCSRHEKMHYFHVPEKWEVLSVL